MPGYGDPTYGQLSVNSPTLTDLPTVKKYCGLSTPTSDDALRILIQTQSAAFLDETGRDSFDLLQYNEVRDGKGSDIMQLAFFPVAVLNSVQIDGVTIPLSTSWNQRGYQWDDLGKITLLCGKFCYGRKNVIVNYDAGYAPINIVNELQTIPATPGPYSIQVKLPNWRTDAGIIFFVGGAVLTPVLTAPAAGQYYLAGEGAYLFNAADQGKQVQISYSCAGYPANLVGAVNEMVYLRYRQRDQINVSSISIGDQRTSYSNADYPKDVWRVIRNYKRYFFVAGF